MTKAERIKAAKRAMEEAADMEKAARESLELAEAQVRNWDGIATRKRGELYKKAEALQETKNRLTYARAERIIKKAWVTTPLRGFPTAESSTHADVVIIGKTAHVFPDGPCGKGRIYRLGQRGFSFEGGQEVEG